MSAKRVAIVGGSGYSGEELVHRLLRHPHFELTAVTSRQSAGQSIAQVFPRFAHIPAARKIQFCEPKVEEIAAMADLVFLALPHGLAIEYALPLLERGLPVVDLSADFRLRSAAVYQEFYGEAHPSPEWLEKAVYGLPELYRHEIKAAQLIASPGCYPTSILLPVLPLLRAGLIEPDQIIADSLSGVSGAGRKAELDYLFCECNESVRPYGVPKHRHLSEIEEQLSRVAGKRVTIQFTPHLVPVNRGILTTIYAMPKRDSGDVKAAVVAEEIGECYRETYGQEPFVRLLQEKALPDTKNVVGTNVLELAWRVDPRTGRLVVMSAEDNIVKGAGGQAIQSANIRCGFPETAGLI